MAHVSIYHVAHVTASHVAHVSDAHVAHVRVSFATYTQQVALAKRNAASSVRSNTKTAIFVSHLWRFFNLDYGGK